LLDRFERQLGKIAESDGVRLKRLSEVEERRSTDPDEPIDREVRAPKLDAAVGAGADYNGQERAEQSSAINRR
jgi:hypothetical protein